MPCSDNVYKPQSAKDIPQVFTAEEGFCKVREDNLHCECWWECMNCCSCGHVPEKNPANCDCEICQGDIKNA